MDAGTLAGRVTREYALGNARSPLPLEARLTTLPFRREDIDQTIPARFEEVVRAFPDHLALTGRDRRWTYDALNRQANQIAHVIRARTMPGVACVACLADHSPEMVIAVLAVMKAGKAHLAVHPRLPVKAQADTVEDVAPELILTTAAFASRAHELAAGRFPVLTIEEVGPHAPTHNPEPVARPHDPSAIFYTSGSTGKPRGIVQSHRAVLHRVWASALHEGITPADRESLLTHCSFGASQWDVFGALLLGTTLCPFDVVSEGLTAFRTWLDTEQITVLHPPVVLFRRFLASLDDARVFPSVRLVVLGGNTVLTADLEGWKRHFARPCVVSFRFSSTEAGLLTVTRIDHDTRLSLERIATGWPVADKELAILDEQGHASAAGEIGELVVRSAFLADGYWRDPGDTDRAFTPDLRVTGRRSYRTGDVGRLLPDGRFVFAGRRDHHVKIRGYRLDTREVEEALLDLGDVSEVAVVAVAEREEQQLLAFVVILEGQKFDPLSLRQRLRALLPEWKLPGRIYAMASLPMTLSGKVDRQRLKAHALREEVKPVLATVPLGVESPRDSLEVRIAAEWQELLGCGPVGRADDNFEQGGDSLKATVLHLHVERLAGMPIPLGTLFVHPTVMGMADVVRRAQLSDPTDPTALPPVLVPFRATGTRPPLFLVPGRLGRGIVRPQFLEIVGAEQPIYGFQAAGLDRARMPQNTIEEMAREYVRAVRYVQPAGPYLLGAACVGSLVVIEMANQLRRAGEQIAPLMLFDPPSRVGGWRRYGQIARAGLRRLSPSRSWRRRWRATLRDRMEHAPNRALPVDEALLDAAMHAAVAFEAARLKYTRWYYDGPVLMLRSAVRLKRDGPPDGQGTFAARLRGEVRLFEAGSTHTEVVTAKSELAARQIQECVDIAREALATLRRHVRMASNAPV